MEGERASKRRRIHGGSTPSSHGNTVPQRSRGSIKEVEEMPGFQLPAKSPSSALNGGANASSRSQPTLAATERNRRTDKREDDKAISSAYQDTNGAHASPETMGHITAKAKLDPLRNQKTMPHSPARAASTVGFFKQFHTPRKAVAMGKKAAKELGEEAGSCDDTPQGTPNPTAGVGDNEMVPSSDPADDEELTTIRTSGRARRRPKRYEDNAAETELNGLGGSRKKQRTLQNRTNSVEEEVRQRAVHDHDQNARSADRHHSTDGDTDPKAKLPSKSALLGLNGMMSSGRRKQVKASPNRVDADRTPETKRIFNAADELADRSASTSEVVTRQNKAGHSPTIESLNSKNELEKPILATDATSIAHEEHETQRFMPADLATIQRTVLEQLTGRRPTRLTGLSDEHAKVSTLVKQTIGVGESNSVLLIGARGSGKTALVNQILREQAKDYPNEFHVIRLNGFIHTDDKIALLEIWRQLGQEMELDSNEVMINNYADTLTTLLALLSHPAEHGREQPEQITKSVIFVLDEFDLFTHHPRQTLLYNLFDIAQSRKAPIAVLGLTTKIDVSESLEKRVKSRFSHRYVHLGLPKSFSAFCEACAAVTKLQPSVIPSESVRASWNAVIDTLMSNEAFEGHLRGIYYRTKSVPEYMSSMLYPMATVSVDDDVTSADILEHILSSLDEANPRSSDSKLDILTSLSTLQAAMLICAARLTAIYNADTVSFALAYEEYKVLASKAKLQASASGSLATSAGICVSSKDVARDAWNALVACGLIIDDGRNVNGGRVDVGLEEIGMSGVDLGQWARWCKEI